MGRISEHVPAMSSAAPVVPVPPEMPPLPPVDASPLSKSDPEAAYVPPTSEPRLAYHVGVLPSCPNEVVHLAGVAFPTTTERVTGTGASTLRVPMRGQIVRITEKKRKQILAAAGRRFVRRTNAMRPTQGEVLVDGAPALAPAIREPGDEPLANHIYMLRRQDLDAPDSGTALPTPLSATASGG